MVNGHAQSAYGKNLGCEKLVITTKEVRCLTRMPWRCWTKFWRSGLILDAGGWYFTNLVAMRRQVGDAMEKPKASG